ncbi:MAG: hypothetical protein A2X83_07480 [Desulfuromonadales bacterium GWD2_54_10]|nr:MAG: hypothetical protein A2X83_07480 [Desulfuromonadales bacterium GWD2_54_10]
MDTKDIIKIVAFIVLLPIVYYIKKSNKTDDFRVTNRRAANFYTGIAVSLILSASLLFVLKYTSLGPKSILLVPILGIASCVVVIYYLSKR